MSESDALSRALADLDIRMMERFVTAQDSVWQDVQDELAAGKKVSHWMWWIFPQMTELGRSKTAKEWGLDGKDEAIAFARHRVLAARLQRCCELLLAVPHSVSIVEVMGHVDAVKLRSSMTLFEAVHAGPLFRQVLDRFYGGRRDGLTLETPDRGTTKNPRSQENAPWSTGVNTTIIQ